MVSIREAARERSVAVCLPSILAIDEAARALTPTDRETVVAFLAQVQAVMQQHPGAADEISG